MAKAALMDKVSMLRGREVAQAVAAGYTNNRLLLEGLQLMSPVEVSARVEAAHNLGYITKTKVGIRYEYKAVG